MQIYKEMLSLLLFLNFFQNNTTNLSYFSLYVKHINKNFYILFTIYVYLLYFIFLFLAQNKNLEINGNKYRLFKLMKIHNLNLSKINFNPYVAK